MHNHWSVTRDFLSSCTLVLVFLIALLAVEPVLKPDGPVTIITDPFSGQSAMNVIAAAQGNILSAGRWPWIAVADGSHDPDFLAKLRAAGALFFLPPITNACLGDPALTDPALQGT